MSTLKTFVLAIATLLALNSFASAQGPHLNRPHSGYRPVPPTYNERFYPGYGYSSNGLNGGYGANYWGFQSFDRFGPYNSYPQYGYGYGTFGYDSGVRQYWGGQNYGPGVIVVPRGTFGGIYVR